MRQKPLCESHFNIKRIALRDLFLLVRSTANKMSQKDTFFMQVVFVHQSMKMRSIEVILFFGFSRFAFPMRSKGYEFSPNTMTEACRRADVSKTFIVAKAPLVMYHFLLESLCMDPDPRIERKKVYPLDFLLLIVFLSTLSGNASWY